MELSHTTARAHIDEGRRDWRRWALSASISLAVHALVPLAFFINWPQPANPEAGSLVITVELAPLPVAPTKAISDLAPGPEQVVAPSEASPLAEQPKPPPLDDPAPPVNASDAEAKLPKPVKPELKPENEKTLALQTPLPTPPIATAPPSAEAAALKAAGPLLGRTAGPSAEAIASWQRKILIQLERFKRYPRAAEGARGVVGVSFTIDRAGRVLASALARSSGSAVLDAEALATLVRATPLPLPPDGITDAELSFFVPIQYVPALRH